MPAGGFCRRARPSRAGSAHDFPDEDVVEASGWRPAEIGVRAAGDDRVARGVAHDVARELARPHLVSGGRELRGGVAPLLNLSLGFCS